MAARPRGLPARYNAHWDRPWTQRARLAWGFRKWLHKHGYWTPHFRLDDSRCHDTARTQVPKTLHRKCRNHAFNLEQLRHELGDQPISILSWYRTPAYNRQIGGATYSQHINAVATDMSRQWVELVGRAKFNAAADKVFHDGGVGRYPAGSVHVDSRGVRARWTTF